MNIYMYVSTVILTQIYRLIQLRSWFSKLLLTFACPSKKAATSLFSQQLPAKPKPPVFCPSISLLYKRESDSDRLMHSMTGQDLAPSRIN